MITDAMHALCAHAIVMYDHITPQYFLPDPVENDVKYQATAQPFLVFGILTTALAVGHHTF
jgi:hypothetical protein